MQKLFSMIVVDDEPTILSGLCDLYPWNNWGFEVVGAYLTADSALEALHGSLTDVVLTDIRMPGMDGLSFASMLSRAFPATCVVLMSAYDDFEYIRQAMRSGVIEYLVKPVRYDQIVSTFMKVHRILSKADTPPDKLSNASDNEYHQQIVHYVRSYVESSPATATLEGAAASIGFTPGHISRIFHQYSGTTFSDYLASQRMTMAAQMLSGPYPSLKDVAYWVGYDSVKSFTQAFVRHYGMTPAEYALGKREG